MVRSFNGLVRPFHSLQVARFFWSSGCMLPEQFRNR